MPAPAWSFEADYFTACNCDWGCPCNFNARPTQGDCAGWGVWAIERGAYGATRLDGTKLALYYAFPGPIEQGKGTARTYIDEAASPAQRAALEAIGTGQAGGGILELFGKQLTTTWLPTRFVPIEMALKDGVGRVRVGDVGEGASELLSYPDGSTIRPWLDLPHGIEFKKGLMTNAKRWWWRDDHPDLLANHRDRYGAWARVRFTQDGLVA